ncbi:MAG: TRAP transporter substrate-binding protein DctP [Myxococcales bacterium]|nr:TRAP transporter substrate-binding protein DctP [Myxococcales bacterium]
MIAWLLLGCQRDRDVEVWRFAIEETRGSVQDTFAQRFAGLVDERTDHRVRVEVYPYGTLGTSDQTTELLYMGSIQLAMASPGHIGKLIPEVQAFLLHFVLSDDEEVNDLALRDPELLALLDELYATRNFELLSVFSEGWMVWTLDRPVRRPEDFAGLKMRVMTSPLLLAAYEAYGASPTPLPYSEVYGALQLSMVDGQVNPVFAIQEMSFYEVTDVMVFARQAPFVTTAIANHDFYATLSPERRAMLDEVIGEVQTEVLEAQRTRNRDDLAIIARKRPDLERITLTEEERAVFRERSMPVRDLYLAQAPRGREVLDALGRAVAKASGEGQVP